MVGVGLGGLTSSEDMVGALGISQYHSGGPLYKGNLRGGPYMVLTLLTKCFPLGEEVERPTPNMCVISSEMVLVFRGAMSSG